MDWEKRKTQVVVFVRRSPSAGACTVGRARACWHEDWNCFLKGEIPHKQKKTGDVWSDLRFVARGSFCKVVWVDAPQWWGDGELCHPSLFSFFCFFSKVPESAAESVGKWHSWRIAREIVLLQERDASSVACCLARGNGMTLEIPLHSHLMSQVISRSRDF